MGDVLLRQQQLDLLQALAEARLRFVGRNAEAAEFVRQERARKADVEPSAGNAVEHADLAGELERMVEHRQHRAGDEPHGLGALRGGAEKHDRVRAVAAVAVEIVLDRARVGEAQLVGFLGDRERLRVVVGRALVGMIDGGKKLHTELHVAPSSWMVRGLSAFLVGTVAITIGPRACQSIERRTRKPSAARRD